jgi:hypothetical protein
MKKTGWRAVACATALGLAAWSGAQAGTVTFDDIAPNIFADGDSFTSGGFSFAASTSPAGLGGLVGSATDNAGFLFGVGPTNAASQFYAGLNDAGVTMTTGNDRALIIKGFDASFLPAVPGFYLEGEQPAGLFAFYETAAGISGLESWFLGAADANGLFAFDTISGAALGGLAQPLRSVTFIGCHVDGQGNCLPAPFANNGNLAQFAIDNINAELPEPGSLMLAALGLGLAGVARRRTAR